MKIRALTTSILFLTHYYIYAQSNWLNGNVIDQKGNAVPFATLVMKGSKDFTTTHADGSFLIRAVLQDSLEISAVNYQTKVFQINTQNKAVYVLPATENILPLVAVTTAFDVKLQKRIAPYSAQVIPSEVINIIPQTNLNDALVGKIAGVQFRSQSGAKLNSQAFARVRGGILLSGDAGPGFVVDGTIVLDANSIDPSTIENITVLKGANATAIFGGFANGAIVITTKKAKLNTSSIQFNQGISFDRVGKLPAFQNTYAGGSYSQLVQYTWQPGHPEDWKALNGKYFHDYTDDASWGPKMEGQEYVPWYSWVPGHRYTNTTAELVPQPDNIRDFWETGITSNTNLAFSRSGQGYSTRISFAKQIITGVIPNSKADKNIVTANLNVDINKFITTGIDLSYNRQIVSGYFSDGFTNVTTGNFYQWNQRNLDMGIMKELRYLITPVGTTASWNWRINPDGYVANDPSAFYTSLYWPNFYTLLDHEDIKQNNSRLFGNAYIKANINSSLDIKATIRMDESNSHYEKKIGSILWPLLDSYETNQQIASLVNYELLLTYRKVINENVRLNALAGANVITYKVKSLGGATAGGLLIPDVYDIYNSVYSPSISQGRLQSKSNSVFIAGDIEFKKWVGASFALRKIWHSTLPESNNSLICPSTGLSFFPFELLSHQPKPISALKLYASWGRVPLTPGIYNTNTYFNLTGQWGNNFMMTAGDVLPDSALKGGLITSYEAGIDVSLFNNRIGLNMNYYNETAAGQPMQINIDASGGFTGLVANASTVKRSGLEFLLNATIISNKNFRWNITIPLGWLLNNPVTKIIEGQERVQPASWKSGLDRNSFASAYQILGKDWGQLIGGGFARNEEGIPLLDSNGMYLPDVDYNYGSIVPKLTGGFQNFFNYKNISLNFSIDYQYGGKFYSCSEYWGNYSGTLAPTAAINDKGKNVRDEITEGGGVHVTGVSSTDGKPVDMYVDAYTYFRQYRDTRIAEPYIHSLSYIKLRELSIGCQLPVTKWKFTKSYLKAAGIAFIARNPWLIYSASKNFDPSEISTVYGEEGQQPPVRSYGLSLNVTF